MGKTLLQLWRRGREREEEEEEEEVGEGEEEVGEGEEEEGEKEKEERKKEEENDGDFFWVSLQKLEGNHNYIVKEECVCVFVCACM